MKRILCFALILLLSLSLFGCASVGNKTLPNEEPPQHNQQNSKSDEEIIAGLVKDFGSKLQAVSLQTPKDIVNKSMQENYSSLVSPTLLVKWQSDPLNAPGRMVSSPWPDRIEILTINKTPEKIYEVKGEIIEITSTEKVNGGIAAKRPITLVVEKIENHWLINGATLGDYEKTGSIVGPDLN